VAAVSATLLPLQKESGPFAVTVTEGAVQDFSPARID
jgi:hypothetical protein